MAGAANMPRPGLWDQVLAFGQYQHATIDGEPVLTVFDASTCTHMLDDFAAHPESGVFSDKQHEIIADLGGDAFDRDKLRTFGDKHALSWADAMCMVVAGQVIRYERHATAPERPPTRAELLQSDGTDRGDGVYVRVSEITPRGADPKDGIASFRYTSPYFVPEKDGWRLLNYTHTNDPRMRGVARALSRETSAPIAMQRVAMTASGPTEKPQMNDAEMMARAGCMESDSPDEKFQKMSAYARKMEEAAEKDKKEKDEAMSRVQKMESDAEEMRRKMEAGAHKEPDGDEGKQAMQAMQRKVDAQAEKIASLLQTIEAEREGNKGAAQAMARFAEFEKAQAKAQAKAKASAAIAMGRVNAAHKGDAEKTEAWLAEKYEKDPAWVEDFLAPEGFHKPSERIAMSRLTQGGAAPGAPDPREGDTLSADDQIDRLIAAETKAAKAAGSDLTFAQAMERVKTKNPALVAAWRTNSGHYAGR